jgi:hypothetical protein
MAPITKYGPKIVLCHIGRSVIAKIQPITVCTDTAIGITTIDRTPITFSSFARCAGVSW